MTYEIMNVYVYQSLSYISFLTVPLVNVLSEVEWCTTLLCLSTTLTALRVA